MAKKKGNFQLFSKKIFCMSKIHIHTNFHENSSKIDCFIGKNRQKTSVANLCGGDFIWNLQNDFEFALIFRTENCIHVDISYFKYAHSICVLK